MCDLDAVAQIGERKSSEILSGGHFHNYKERPVAACTDCRFEHAAWKFPRRCSFFANASSASLKPEELWWIF